MNYDNIEKINNDRYTKRFKEFGDSPKTLGWGSIDQQKLRFKNIIKNINLENKNILDIGCGLSHFANFLEENNISINNYTGIDINKNFIEHNKIKYPKYHFYKYNILKENYLLKEKWDIVVMIGILNYNFKDDSNYDYSKTFIKKAFEYTNDVLYVDFLSTYLTETYPKEDFVFYHNPVDMLEYSLTLTQNVNIIHNYKPIPQKEFCIILNKKD